MTSQIIAPWKLLPVPTPFDIVTLAKQEKWLQLTQANQRPDKGWVESENAFASAGKIIRLEFDYISWGGNGGKGLSIYLFDAGVAKAGTGGIGGVGLGYIKMIGAYVGIGLDETAGFTLMDPNTMTENTTDVVGAGSFVTIRGTQIRNYYPDARYPVRSFSLFSSAAQYKTRREAIAAGGVKHVTVIFSPQLPKFGYTIDLLINGAPVFSKFDYPYAAPASMKIGVAATNGPDTSSNHEIRNFRADVSDVKPPPPVDLFRSNIFNAYIQHHGELQFFKTPILTDGDRVHRGWDGSGDWDKYPGEYLDYHLEFQNYPQVNTIVTCCRQDDALQQEPTDTTTFTQHGAIDFSILGQDVYLNTFHIASVSGNNLVKRTFTVPKVPYSNVWVQVDHAASHGASIVNIEGYDL